MLCGSRLPAKPLYKPASRYFSQDSNYAKRLVSGNQKVIGGNPVMNGRLTYSVAWGGESMASLLTAFLAALAFVFN